MFHMEYNLDNLKMEIVLILLRYTRLHVREIANKLKTNHTTILRKTREMMGSNVLDFEVEGKNKIFFIRNSEEARDYIHLAERYKKIKILDKYPLLRKVVETIRKNKKIKLAILFGSYAKGTAKKDSDIDIFIETKNKKLKQEISKIGSLLSIKIGTYSGSSELKREIDKNHVILKGIEEYYGK